MKFKEFHKYRDLIYIISGSILFALSVNLFVYPIHIYNGGIVGLSQLLRDTLIRFFHLQITFNLSGIINMALNVPLFIFAYRRMSARFVRSTLLSVVVQTIAFTVIPILQKPLVDDVFISIIIAAAIGGYGCSLVFKARGSSGGMDIVGIYQSMRHKGSVGRTYMAVNLVIYSLCALIYNIPAAIYSIVYASLFAIILDKFHESNIEVSIMVFSKNHDLKRQLIQQVHRGITYWEGFGVYTGEASDIFVTVCDKSEVKRIKQIIRDLDEHAFIIVSENMKVDGNLEKRLI